MRSALRIRSRGQDDRETETCERAARHFSPCSHEIPQLLRHHRPCRDGELERCAFPPVVLEVVHEVVSRGRRTVNLHEAIGVREGQWPQDHAVDDADDRGIRADADRRRRKSFLREETARRVAKIMKKVVQPSPAARVAAVFCDAGTTEHGHRSLA